jgi:hypothetical protein
MSYDLVLRDTTKYRVNLLVSVIWLSEEGGGFIS